MRLLGYQDSNLEWLYQKQLCCQLHHTPMAFGEIHIHCDVHRVSSRDRDYQTTPVFLQIAWSNRPNWGVGFRWTQTKARLPVGGDSSM